MRTNASRRPRLNAPDNLLTDHVLEILILRRNLDVNIEISMIDAFDFNEHGEVRPPRLRAEPKPVML